MTTTDSILAAVRRVGADLRAVGGEVHVLHVDRLPPDLRDRLRANRAAVVAALAESVPIFAPTVLWAAGGHEHVVKALAEWDAERLAEWEAKRAAGVVGVYVRSPAPAEC